VTVCVKLSSCFKQLQVCWWCINAKDMTSSFLALINVN
jgi:hypothetical protein